ncbi:MAG: tRNA guanosine(15) transglycosylase TgtA [Nitrososphaeria archaeon]
MPTFEVKKTDLAARIGTLKTRSGTIETPTVLPVIHPFNQVIKPKEMAKMGFDALMTNSYLILRENRRSGESYNVHRFLDFEKPIMTDSGAYQLLQYGEVETTPEEIVEFQKSIGTDVGVILDTPTGFTRNRRRAEETVKKTLEAAERSAFLFGDDKILWAGPIQGGTFYDLVEESARMMTKLDFDIFALGSPTQVMEQYNFEHLVRMILAAKGNIPLDRPLHLFGAGHPLTLSMAVSLGCDLFDSASYILYAKRGAYMTEHGTHHLDDLNYLPCECAVCSKYTAKEIRESKERTRLLATHNLHILSREIKSIRQAIYDGRLWEYVATKSRSHPKTWAAFKTFKELTEYLGKGTPIFKSHGLYLCSTPDQYRPEAKRSFDRIIRNIKIEKKILVVYLSTTNDHSFLYSLRAAAEHVIGAKADTIQFCAGIFPIGVVPIELCDIYPFSQYEISLPLDEEMKKESLNRFKRFLSTYKFKKAVLVDHSNGKYDEIVRWFKRNRTVPERKIIRDRRTESIINKIEVT